MTIMSKTKGIASAARGCLQGWVVGSITLGMRPDLDDFIERPYAPVPFPAGIMDAVIGWLVVVIALSLIPVPTDCKARWRKRGPAQLERRRRELFQMRLRRTNERRGVNICTT